MKTADISDETVCHAYEEARHTGEFPYEVLMRWTGYPLKVAYAAMERAAGNGLIDAGVSLRSGWLTEAGKSMVEKW